jgi:anti-sigma B factor antagonist
MKIKPIKSKKSKALTEKMPVDSHYFAISGDMTIHTAAQDHEALLKVVTESEALAIDLSQLEEIDTSGIQQLLAIKRWYEKENKTCHLHSVSETGTELLQLLNLESRLELTPARY